MGIYSGIRFDEDARHGYRTLRDPEHTESKLLFEKGRAADLRRRVTPGARSEGMATVRDTGDRTSRTSRMRIEKFDRRGRKSRKSIQYAKRAMANRIAASAMAAGTASEDDDRGSDEGFTDSLANVSRKTPNRDRRRLVGRNTRNARAADSTSLSRTELRKANKARAKELTKAARTKRQASKIALDPDKTSQAVAATGETSAATGGKDIFEASSRALERTGGAAFGTVGAFLFGTIVFFVVVGALLGVAASDGMARQAGFEGLGENEAAVAVYLTSKGLDPLHTAAVMGNVEAESGFDPALVETGSGEGFGLCQWSFGRKSQLFAYAAAKGKPADDLGLQLDFLWAELTGEGDAAAYTNVQYDHAGFLKTTGLAEAVMYFGRNFERPNEAYAHWDRRIASAERYYAALTATSALPEGAIVKYAASKLGRPYVWGAAGPDAFDCSGLVQWSYAQAGIASISRTTYTQIKQCVEIPESLARPGDLVFCNYSAPGVPEHVTLYIGDGKVIHAPQQGDVVKISPVASWADAKYFRFIG